MHMERLDKVRFSRLVTYQGDCSELACPLPQQEYWIAQKGVKYHFLLYRYKDYLGNYSLLFHKVDE
jgi:hypothetical protein